MLTFTPEPLSKRAIGRPPTEPPAARPYSEAEIEAKEAEIAPLLTQMFDDIERMKSDGTPGPVRERHEKAYGELHWANVGLRDPERAAQLEKSAAPTDDSLLAKSEIALLKADPSLSPFEACKQAMRLNVDDYFAQSGTSRPAPATGQLSKAEADRDADESSVERRAKQLESQGLRPTAAYAKALSESGHYAGSAAA
jgi:hypothetical protein